MKKKDKVKRILAGCLSAIVAVSALPVFTQEVQAVEKAAVEREDNSIVYFADCGDYVVNTVCEGDQLGTHNSVTDQVYGEDAVTGYSWGIVDAVSNPLTNGTSSCGGVFTDHTWPYEFNTANTDVSSKTDSNRYTKNQYENGIEVRYLDYKFELEAGTYQVELYCDDPWGCSQSPALLLDTTGKSQDDITAEFKNGEGEKIQAGNAVKKEVTLPDDGELTVSLRATGSENLAINLAYILIKDPSKSNFEDCVKKDLAAISFANLNISENLSLPTEGDNGSAISWESSNPGVIAADGTVTRPAAGEPDAAVSLTATVAYGDYSGTKTFYFTVYAQSSILEAEQFELDEVLITDEYYLSAQNSDVDFLKSFDANRLLSGFRTTAGLSTQGASPYGGWENSLIGGHCVGHYLTASAQAVLVTGDEELKNQLDYLVEELKACQDALGTGFIFGATVIDSANVEIQFDNVESGRTNINTQAWVPWYTMHKLIAGLVDVYKYTGNTEALDVASELGLWVYNRVSGWSETTRNTVLGIEYGGMNDCLYELYKQTNDTRHRDAAQKFDETSLYQTILSGASNTLNGKHANTTIPKFIGALNRYITLAEVEQVYVTEYLEYAEEFWELVVEKHVFITGGTSVMEHFRADNALDAIRTQCTCESCCANNMLKLSKELYKITGEKKYADYYENTLRNAIMGAISDDGAFSYFTPMATGYYKVFGATNPAESNFWCCTGSGMENYTKLGDSIYFTSGESLVVNQYVASEVTWNSKNIKLTQNSDVTTSETAEFTVNIMNNKTRANMNLYLRVPDWIDGLPTVLVNGSEQSFVISGGYISINRTWNDGDQVVFTYPMKVTAFGLADDDTVFGFKYGPTVLAAKLGTEKMGEETWAGVDLTAPYYKVVGSEQAASTINYGGTSRQILGTETLVLQDNMSISEFMEDIDQYLVRTSDTALEFEIKGTDAEEIFGGSGLTFVPFNTLNNERYGIYWYFEGSDTTDASEKLLAEKEEGRFAASLIDSIQPGYGQYENDKIHQMEEYNSVSETALDEIGSTRAALAGGYFAYHMVVEKGTANYLLCQFASEDNGKTIKITAGDTVIAEVTLNYEGTETFYKVYYELPQEVVEDAEVLTADGKSYDVVKVRFESNNSQDSARIVNGLYMTKAYSNIAEITEIASANSVILSGENSYTIVVPSGTSQIKVDITLADKLGLLYLNGNLVNDSKSQTIQLDGAETNVDLLVYAQDYQTISTYQLKVIADSTLMSEQRAVQDVIALIDAIGTVEYTSASKDKIDAARKAYDALSDELKQLVSNYSKLSGAETTYTMLKTADELSKNQETATKVIKLIDAIGTVQYNSSSKSKIDAARKAYNALTSTQKKLVTNYSKLTAAETKYQQLANANTTGTKTTTDTKTTADTVKKNQVYTVGNYKYKVTSVTKKTVTVTGVKKKTIKTIKVKDTVKIKGKKFKVTVIGKAAFKGCKKATKAVIGKNVKTIKANAFYNCKKLKKITIKSKVLKKVGKKAFKGINSKAKIKVPAKKLKAYKKLLKNKGQGKKVTITK